MSDPITLATVTELAAQLPPTDQRRLAETILRHLDAGAVQSPRRAWREIRGSAPFPLCGEDAQAWVSRTRRDSEELRERRRSANP
jgi:hypothetical protein